MTYLGRPVFQFAINWLDPVNKSFVYDLKEVSLGFGAEYFTSLQDNVVQGWQFSVDLLTDADINSFDTFTAALNGRLVGFWLPTPMETLQISAIVDTTHFDIVSQGLSSTWNQHPDIYLYFGTGTPACAKINAVTDNGNGTERVTLDAAVTLSATTPVYRLHYVRLANDDEEATLIADGYQRRTVKVVELPEEYANVETGLQPIYLYHFSASTPVNIDWWYTSFAADVISGGITYSAWPTTHGAITHGTKAESETLDIEAKYGANHPFALYLPLPFSQIVNVTVYEVSYSAPDTQKTRFVGQIRSVEDMGEKLTAHCDSFLEILSRKAPRHLMSAQCNYFVFDPLTCKANRLLYETIGTVASVPAFDGSTQPSVFVTLLFPTSDRESADYFANGWIETGFGTGFEMRTVIYSTWHSDTNQLELTLNAPLLHAAVSQMVQLIPGCDGALSTCTNKFANQANFGGFPFIPLRNPTITNVLGLQSSGGKK